MIDLVRIPRKTKVEQESEVERVYRALKAWLIEARLAPGDFLSELELANRCKTSRTPIREAFSRLAQDGWLTRIRRKGYLVTPISIREIVELYEYRRVLECFAAERVAESATREQIAELKMLVAPEIAPKPVLAAILQANQKFHLRLAEMAANQRVVAQLALTLGYVSRLDTLCTQTVPGWIGHAAILRAIEGHQSAKSRQAMSAHIDLSRDKMVKLFSS